MEQKSNTKDSWIFYHKCAQNIYNNETFKVGSFPCINIPVKSNYTVYPIYTLAQLIVGDHHNTNHLLGN